MKRDNENAEEESVDSGFKKLKLVSGSDKNSGRLDLNEDQEGRIENRGVGVDKGEDPFRFPDNYDGSYLGGLEEFDNCGMDFDLNVSLFDGTEEELKGSGFDLNVPLPGASYGEAERPAIKDHKQQIIEITSDNSDDEVVILGSLSVYNNDEKGKQKVPGSPWLEESPSYAVEDLINIGLRILKAESSSVQGREEKKGKSTVDDSWLSLNILASMADEVDIEIAIDDSSSSTESDEDDEEAALDEPAIFRGRWEQEYRISSARRLARVSAVETNKSPSSGQNQQPSTSSVIEQLGSCPGPFGEALKMVQERTSKQTAEELIKWKPFEDKELSSSAPFVPKLLDISLKVLAENAEAMVSLKFVPGHLRGRLTDMLCDERKMDVHILNLLVEGCPSEIRIKNCSSLTENQFQQAFEKCQTKDLMVLQLDLCSQFISDYAFNNTLSISSSSFASLAVLSLRGASRLSDLGIRDIVTSAPALRSINLGQCTLLTCDSIDFIAASLGSKLRELYIDDCPKMDAALGLPALKKFKYLEVLSVAGIRTVTDQVVIELTTVFGQSIKELDFSNCLELTDSSLKAIGSNCPDLHSLDISNVAKLTDLGMEHLANGCRSICKLKLCRNGFSDEAMAAFLESSGSSLTELLLNNMSKVGPHTALSLARSSKKLLNLDLSWCRKISDEALGLIVDSCSSLRLLKVFGCRQITNVFLNGHSNPVVKIIGLNFKPLLDHVNLLEPENVLLRYSPLPMDAQD